MKRMFKKKIQESKLSDYSYPRHLDGFSIGDKVHWTHAKFDINKDRVFVIRSFYPKSKMARVSLEDNKNFGAFLPLENLELVK